MATALISNHTKVFCFILGEYNLLINDSNELCFILDKLVNEQTPAINDESFQLIAYLIHMIDTTTFYTFLIEQNKIHFIKALYNYYNDRGDRNVFLKYLDYSEVLHPMPNSIKSITLLSQSAFRGHHEMVKFLIEDGGRELIIKMPDSDKSLSLALFHAVYSGKTQIVQTLLSDPSIAEIFDPTHSDANFHPLVALHRSISSVMLNKSLSHTKPNFYDTYYDIFMLLYNKGAHYDQAKSIAPTEQLVFFNIAIKANNIPLLECILESGAIIPCIYNTDDPHSHDSNPLCHAIGLKSIVLLQWLLDKGINPNSSSDLRLKNPMMKYFNHITLDKKDSGNQQIRDEMLSLLKQYSVKCKEMPKESRAFLVPNKPGKEANPVALLCNAIKQGNFDTVKKILSLHKKDKILFLPMEDTSHHPLACAVQSLVNANTIGKQRHQLTENITRDYQCIIKLLIENGARFEQASVSSKLILYICASAVITGNDAFLSKIFETSQVDIDSNTFLNPLKQAVERNNPRIVKWLLEKGANPLVKLEKFEIPTRNPTEYFSGTIFEYAESLQKTNNSISTHIDLMREHVMKQSESKTDAYSMRQR